MDNIESEDIPLLIAENYILHWDNLFPAFREVVQNTRDGIVQAAKTDSSSNQIYDPINIAWEPNEKKTRFSAQYNYDGGDISKKLGEIRYKKDRSSVVFVNKGRIVRDNLLFGGTTKDANDKDTAGQFGEGLKLAAIGLLRFSKQYTIQTGKENWEWSFVKQPGFSEKVLTVRITKRKRTANQEDVKVMIGNISPIEWEELIKKFVFLSPQIEQKSMLYISPERHTWIVQLPSGNSPVNGCLFVNGIFVRKVSSFSDAFDLYGMQLGRDRDWPKMEDKELLSIIAKVMIGVISRLKMNNMDYKQHLARTFKLLSFDSKQTICLPSQCNVSGIPDDLFKVFQEQHGILAQPYYYPSFMSDPAADLLNNSKFKFVKVSEQLHSVLLKSQFYQSLSSLRPQVVTLYENFVPSSADHLRVVRRVERLCRTQLKFKKFDHSKYMYVQEGSSSVEVLSYTLLNPISNTHTCFQVTDNCACRELEIISILEKFTDGEKKSFKKFIQIFKQWEA